MVPSGFFKSFDYGVELLMTNRESEMPPDVGGVNCKVTLTEAPAASDPAVTNT